MPDRRDHFSIAILDDLDRAQGIEHAVAAAPNSADLLVLPYLGPNEWFLDRLDRDGYGYAERQPSRSIAAAVRAAARRKTAVAVSFYEVVGEGVFYATTAIVSADGTVFGSYRQAHAVNKPGWHEQLYFQPGTIGQFPVFAIGRYRVGFLLGSDLWVPEAARLLALGGAQMVIAQTGLSGELLSHAGTLAAARVIENGRAVILANRGNGTSAFAGTGCNLALTKHGEGWSMVAIDLTEQRERLLANDPLRSRRPRLYGGLAAGEEGALS